MRIIFIEIKIIMFLISGITVAGICFAQSDFSSTGYQKEDSFALGNGSDSAGTNSGRDTNDQQGNLFPNSSSEKANGVYTAGVNSGRDTIDQDYLFPESISGKANGDYGFTGGISTH